MLPCTTIITLSIHSRYLKTRLISTSAIPQPHTHTHTSHTTTPLHTHTHTPSPFPSIQTGGTLALPTTHTPAARQPRHLLAATRYSATQIGCTNIPHHNIYTHSSSQPASQTRGTLSLTTTTLRRASADTYSPQGDTLPPKWGARTFITPCTFRCTSAHHTLLHQRVAIHHIDA